MGSHMCPPHDTALLSPPPKQMPVDAFASYRPPVPSPSSTQQGRPAAFLLRPPPPSECTRLGPWRCVDCCRPLSGGAAAEAALGTDALFSTLPAPCARTEPCCIQYPCMHHFTPLFLGPIAPLRPSAAAGSCPVPQPAGQNTCFNKTPPSLAPCQRIVMLLLFELHPPPTIDRPRVSLASSAHSDPLVCNQAAQAERRAEHKLTGGREARLCTVK
jgi:hypothetical protein